MSCLLIIAMVLIAAVMIFFSILSLTEIKYSYRNPSFEIYIYSKNKKK